jgi:RND family efflux transporter MFP subunit
MRTGLWMATAVVGLATAGAAALAPALLQQSEAKELPATGGPVAQAARVVMVTTARLEPERAVRHLPGFVAARTEADLAFRVGGKLLSRGVSVGDRVAAGDVVATLDETDLRLQLEAAEAERAAARIALDKAEINLARVSSLESRGWASDQASDVETVAVEEARARLLQAQRNADLARNQLDYATLHADADGVVTDTMVEAGQVLAAGQPVVRVARTGEREAVVAIPEATVAELRGAEAVVELWSETGRRIPARLRELSPVADPATRTFEARYTLEDPGEAAALGMSVTVTLAQPAAAASTALPLSALLDSGSGPVVWVVGADGRLAARAVAVADYDGGSARIAGGLEDGDRVVILGAHKLQAGEAVRAVEAEG